MPLHFNLDLKFNRKTLTITGIAGVIILLGICALPQLLAASLDEDRAKKEVHAYLKRDLSNRLMAELQAGGARMPDRATAQGWEDAYKRLDRTEIVSVKIGRFLFVPPFSSSRMFIVKAEIRSPDQREETRYFSLSARSKFFDVFWVSEQPRWMWTFAY